MAGPDPLQSVESRGGQAPGSLCVRELRYTFCRRFRGNLDELRYGKVPDSAINVFFYGLFMDESLLASKGVKPGRSEPGHVDDYRLHIGERATLLPSEGDRSYGVLMEITPDEAAALYSDESVRDYVAEPVVVYLRDNKPVDAVCYNLPASKLAGENRLYAADLLVLATRLGMPESHIALIRSAAEPSEINGGPS